MTNFLFHYLHPLFKRIKPHCLFASMLLLGVFGARAQHYEFKHLGSLDGLIGNSVYSTIEDTSGFLWFTTNRTICRYDGKQFTYFGKADGYTEDGAYFIYKDKSSVIWVISFNFKLFYFNGTRFIEFTAVPKASWLCEDDSGLIHVLTRESKIKTIQQFQVIETVNLVQDYYFNIVALGKYKWLLSSNNVNYLSDRNNRKKVLAVSCGLFVNPSRVFKLSNGNVLFSICSNIYLFEAQTEKITLLYTEKAISIIAYFEDNASKDVFIATTHGALKFSQGNIFANPIRILEDKTIQAIGKSKDGLYWFCSKGQGIFYGNFTSRHLTPQDGLPVDVNYIRASKKGIFFASQKGTIGKLINNGTSITPKLLLPSSYSLILKAIKLPNEDVHFLGPGSNEIRCTGLSNKLLSKERVYFLYDNQPVLFYGIHNRMLYYSTKTNKVIFNKQITPYVFSTPNKEFVVPNAFLGDSAFVFIYGNGYVIATLQKNVVSYKKYSLKGISLANVVPSSSGSLLFSTPTNGIIIVKPDKGIKYVNTNNGLISNYCNNIYYENNQLWVCTEQGLSRVKLTSTDEVLSIQNYNAYYYLLNNNVRDIAITDSLVYAVTDNGISIFNPNQSVSNDYTPNIYIEKTTINGNVVNPQPRLTVPYNQNNLSIYYQAITMRKALSVSYRYRLNGIDTGYTYTKESNVNYAKLPAGNYEFIVYATNGNGKWSKYPAKINFTITAPYWQALWFKGLVVALILGIVFIIIKRRDTLLRRKQENKKRLVESELKALRLQMNPHFIFNTLNSLQKFILQYKPIEANQYIAKFSRLMRWIMVYSDKQQISLQEELDFLTLYIELEQLRFKNAFTTNIEIDETLNPQEVFIPSLIVQPFVENAIKYGLTEKPKTEQGALGLLIKTSGDLLYVTITDNGVGRDLIKKRQQTEVSKPASTGIKSTTERLLILHNNQVKNPVVITDLFDEHHHACGTKVELIIPLKYG